MGSLPLHPAIVHLPLGLAFLMPLIAIFVAFAVHRGKLPRFAWGAVLVLQLVLVGSGLFAMNTGEADEERVEAVVAEQPIEAHEDAAKAFVWSSAAVAGIFLLGVALPGRRWRSTAMALGAVGSIVVAGLAVRTGHVGGELVYAHGAASAHAPADRAAAEAAAQSAPGEQPIVRSFEEHEEEDDD